MDGETKRGSERKRTWALGLVNWGLGLGLWNWELDLGIQTWDLDLPGAIDETSVTVQGG